MKTYEILMHGPAMSDYIKGRVTGIVYALSGMPEKEYAWYESADGLDMTVGFDATPEQSATIVKCIEKMYPNAYVGVRVVE